MSSRGGGGLDGLLGLAVSLFLTPGEFLAIIHCTITRDLLVESCCEHLIVGLVTEYLESSRRQKAF
jgi:hypothetical protein